MRRAFYICAFLGRRLIRTLLMPAYTSVMRAYLKACGWYEIGLRWGVCVEPGRFLLVQSPDEAAAYQRRLETDPKFAGTFAARFTKLEVAWVEQQNANAEAADKAAHDEFAKVRK